MKSVSVIIPVYKKEKYLAECLKSVLNQTFMDIEVICINDCSPDASGKILQEFKNIDERVIVINNKDNLGAAYSRNIGIDMATGEYLLILDADDTFDPELIKMTYRRCKQDNLDLLLYDYDKYNNYNGSSINYSMPLPIRNRILKQIFSCQDIDKFSFQICPAGPWLKMYRREFLCENKIYFQNLSSSNDLFFGKMVLLFANRIGYIDESLVRYRNNTEYQISNNKKEGLQNFIKAIIAVKEKMKEHGFYQKNVKSFNTYAFRLMMMYFYDADSECVHERYEQTVIACKELFDGLDIKDAFLNQHFASWLLSFMNSGVEKHLELSIDNEYRFVFEKEKEKVEYLQKYLDEQKFCVALWGYGKNGKTFAREWMKAGLRLDNIIDINLVGTQDNISSYDIIEGRRFAILVTTGAFSKEILETISEVKKESVLIDLQSYFTYGFELDQCVF